MAKGKKLKENRKLRREVELLRAQLSSQKTGKHSSVKPPSYTADSSDLSDSSDTELITRDIMKTAALSALALSIIIAIWLYQ
jgi:hypothetical protein